MKIRNIKDKVLTVFLMIAIILLMYFLDISCFWIKLFKFPCPGCGMTRAYINLLHLDFRKAFDYHPMFWSVPILGVMFFTDGKIFKQQWINSLVLVLILIGFFACWIFRLIEFF